MVLQANKTRAHFVHRSNRTCLSKHTTVVAIQLSKLQRQRCEFIRQSVIR